MKKEIALWIGSAGPRLTVAQTYPKEPTQNEPFRATVNGRSQRLRLTRNQGQAAATKHYAYFFDAGEILYYVAITPEEYGRIADGAEVRIDDAYTYRQA